MRWAKVTSASLCACEPDADVDAVVEPADEVLVPA
jgi:hypothetical protein